MDAAVVVVSRGSDMSVVLTSLLAQDAVLPLHCVLDRMPTRRDSLLLDCLRRTGWDVSVSLQRSPGVGQARYEAADHIRAEVMVCLDDDAMLKPSTALTRLAGTALSHAFSCPIIRYVHEFDPASNGIPDHTEIWEPVADDDPRVHRALATNGDGWRRVYEYGSNQSTRDLGGTAFAVGTARYRAAVLGLAGWQGGGEDHYLGRKLCDKWGPGVALSGVYAYHVGEFSANKWGFDTAGLRLIREDPEVFRRYAVAVHGMETTVGGPQ
jgi:hypothetical protein